MGQYVVYRLSDDFVLRWGECQPGMESDQVLDPEAEGVIYLDHKFDPQTETIVGGVLTMKEGSESNAA